MGFLLLVLLLIGAFFRLYRIFDFPPSIFIDEYNLALNALDIYTEKNRLPFFGFGWYGTPAPFLYYLNFIFRLIGPSVYALKLAWFIPSFLTLVLAFLLAKKLFNTAVAFYTLIFLVFSPIHIHLSRWAHGAISIPLFLLISIYTYLLFKERFEIKYLFLCALFLGFAFFTYVGGRVFILFFIFITLGDILLLSLKKSLNLKKILFYAFFWLIFLIIISPNLFYNINHPNEFWIRFNEISILRAESFSQEGFRVVFDNIKKYFLMLIYLPDPNPRHTPFPSRPVFSPFVVFLFLTGFLFLIFQKKYKLMGLFLFWLLSILIGGILTDASAAPSIFRTASIIPLVYIVASFSLHSFQKLLNNTFVNRGIYFGSFIITVALFLFSFQNLFVFFSFFHLDQNKRIIFWDSFTKTENVVAQLAKRHYSQNIVYLSDDFYWFSSTQFEIRSHLKSKGYPYKLFPKENPGIIFTHLDKSVYIILEKKYFNLIEYFRRFYPQSGINIIKDEKKQPVIITISIPKI